MTEILREVIEEAERLAVGESTRGPENLAQRVNDLDLAQTGSEEERAYLAVLLDWLGLREQATLVLQWSDSRTSQDRGAGTSVLRNIEGMLAASHGQYGQAAELFEEALVSSREGTSTRMKILANLAAASLRAGHSARAVVWLAEANKARSAAGDPAVDILLASVQANIAEAKGDGNQFRVAVSALSEASRSRIAQLGADHPQSLMALANLATVEFKLAYAEESFERKQSAVGVLEVVSRRLAAEIGADHPQALVAMANLCAAELVIARENPGAHRLEAAVAALQVVSQRLDSVLGADHPESLLISSQVTSALQDMDDSSAYLTDDESYIASGDIAPEYLNLRVRAAELGKLTFLAAGDSGRVFQAETFRLADDDQVPLAYKEFVNEQVEQVRSAQAVVVFRVGLSSAERAELDRYTAWPRALVEDASGTVCGVLMPLVPVEFFCRQIDPESGQVISKPRAMSWLITDAVQRSVAQVDLAKVDSTDRLILLAQLVYVIGMLHKRGWVFGDLSSKNIVFMLDPPRMMLLGCDTAAARANPERSQPSTPFWDAPECPLVPLPSHWGQALQDDVTDIYKLGLAILRCLTPGKGASTSRSVSRFERELDTQGIDVVGRALSVDRSRRPAAKDLYSYLYGVVSSRTAVPTVLAVSLTTPCCLRGQDARIEWQIEKAENITVSVGRGFTLQVDPAIYSQGCVFRPEESGMVSIDVRNRFGTVSINLGDLTLYEVPSFRVNVNYPPGPEVPSVPEMLTVPSLHTIDLIETLRHEISEQSTDRVLSAQSLARRAS